MMKVWNYAKCKKVKTTGKRKMGELNLDKIDRAMIQEYKRRHDLGCLEKAAEEIESLQPEPKIPEHSVR